MFFRLILFSASTCLIFGLKCYSINSREKKVTADEESVEECQNATQCFKGTGNFGDFSLIAGCDDDRTSCELYGNLNKWEENVERNAILNGECGKRGGVNYCCCGTDLCNTAKPNHLKIVYTLLILINYFW